MKEMKRAFIPVLLLILLAVGVQAAALKVEVDVSDFKKLAEASLTSVNLQEITGQDSIIVKLVVEDKEYYARVEGSTVTLGDASLGEPDFTLLMSPAAFLAVSNAEQKEKVIKLVLSRKVLKIRARDPLKQALIDAALASDLVQAEPVQDGTLVRINGQDAILRKMERYNNIYRAQVGQDNYVVNQLGAPIGALSRNHDRFANPPANVPVYFNRPPGILAQSPGLVYDTVTQNTNLLTPRTVFQRNPGLIGPNQILANNPGLLGPADIAMLNPGLRGPAEFAYMMGIGAHSNSARHVMNQGLVPGRMQNRLGATNRWGQSPGLGGRP